MSGREELSWELFGTASREQVAGDGHGYVPDIIMSIARGGLFVAGSLGYALDVKNVHVMNVEFYTGVAQRLPVPIVLPPVPDVVDLSGARVLVADDDRWINFPWSARPPVVHRAGQVLDA